MVNSKEVISEIKIEPLILIQSRATQVKAMVQGKDRRPELGYKMALLCRFANP